MSKVRLVGAAVGATIGLVAGTGHVLQSRKKAASEQGTDSGSPESAKPVSKRRAVAEIATLTAAGAGLGYVATSVNVGQMRQLYGTLQAHLPPDTAQRAFRSIASHAAERASELWSARTAATSATPLEERNAKFAGYLQGVGESSEAIRDFENGSIYQHGFFVDDPGGRSFSVWAQGPDKLSINLRDTERRMAVNLKLNSSGDGWAEARLHIDGQPSTLLTDGNEIREVLKQFPLPAGARIGKESSLLLTNFEDIYGVSLTDLGIS